MQMTLGGRPEPSSGSIAAGSPIAPLAFPQGRAALPEQGNLPVPGSRADRHARASQLPGARGTFISGPGGDRGQAPISVASPAKGRRATRPGTPELPGGSESALPAAVAGTRVSGTGRHQQDPSRRPGRWVHSGGTGQHATAGWLLEGSPLVLEFEPGMADGSGRGLRLLRGWPGARRARVISPRLDTAMAEIGLAWEEYRALPCRRCGRGWDYHQAGPGDKQAAWAGLSGCGGHVVSPLAPVSPFLREWMGMY